MHYNVFCAKCIISALESDLECLNTSKLVIINCLLTLLSCILLATTARLHDVLLCTCLFCVQRSAHCVQRYCGLLDLCMLLNENFSIMLLKYFCNVLFVNNSAVH